MIHFNKKVKKMVYLESKLSENISAVHRTIFMKSHRNISSQYTRK